MHETKTPGLALFKPLMIPAKDNTQRRKSSLCSPTRSLHWSQGAGAGCLYPASIDPGRGVPRPCPSWDACVPTVSIGRPLTCAQAVELQPDRFRACSDYCFAAVACRVRGVCAGVDWGRAGGCAGGARLLLVDVQAYDGRSLSVLVYVEIVLDAHGVANS